MNGPLLDVVAKHPRLEPEVCKVLVALVRAPMDRPKSELVVYLSRFPELSDDTIAPSIEALIDSGLLTEDVQPGGLSILKLSPKWAVLLADELDVPVSVVKAAKRSEDQASLRRTWSLEDLGDVGSGSQYTSWIAGIASSKHEVLIWTMSSAYPAVRDAVDTCCSRGVNVRVLVGGHAAVSGVRGLGEAERAEASAKAWSELSERHASLEVRVATDESDLAGCGSTLIDRRLFRFTVYDYRREAGSQGKMLSISARDRGHSVNLIGAYESLFEDAWSRSEPVAVDARGVRRVLRNASWRLRKARPILLLASAAALFTVFPVWSAFDASAASASWFVALTEMAKAGGGAVLILGVQDGLRHLAQGKRLRARESRER